MKDNQKSAPASMPTAEEQQMNGSNLKIGALQPTAAAFGSRLDQMRAMLDQQKWVLDTIERHRRDFLNGNKAALPLAINICGLSNQPLQKWMVDAWAKACNAVFSGDVHGWDHVLRDHKDIIKTPARLAKVRARLKLGSRMMSLLHSDPPKIIDETLFQKLGKQLTITTSQAAHLYYEFSDHQRPRAKRKRSASSR